MKRCWSWLARAFVAARNRVHKYALAWENERLREALDRQATRIIALEFANEDLHAELKRVAATADLPHNGQSSQPALAANSNV
jgi:transposase